MTNEIQTDLVGQKVKFICGYKTLYFHKKRYDLEGKIGTIRSVWINSKGLPEYTVAIDNDLQNEDGSSIELVID